MFYLGNQANLWNSNFISGDLDTVSNLAARNTIEARIACDMSNDVYAQAAALEASPLKAHVFEIYLKNYDPWLRDHI